MQVFKFFKYVILVNLLAFFFILTSFKPFADDAGKFKGMWKLDKYESLISGNWLTDSAKLGYSGFILYDGENKMSVHLMPAGYSQFHPSHSDSLSADDWKEVADHYHSSFVYFADYKVQGRIVEHTIQSCTEAVNIGKTLKREYEFKGDTLLLIPVNSEGKKSRLRWIKLP
ncbi:MAG: lipocalin-like domain-containing protein [Bacteroidota bacterium]|nr:lipocalin-like domain-containing protein [Bacteroidota bacterium]